MNLPATIKEGVLAPFIEPLQPDAPVDNPNRDIRIGTAIVFFFFGRGGREMEGEMRSSFSFLFFFSFIIIIGWRLFMIIGWGPPKFVTA